jgi:hypothetical protein
MSKRWDAERDVAARLASERGTIVREAETRIALCYPSPYRAAMSSLGYQHIYRRLNAIPDVAADRAVRPDDLEAAAGQPWLTLERSRPVASYPLLAFSVAYELEILGLLECLALANIPVRADARDDRHPLIVAGGPLTFSNPVPLAPYVDVIVMGEGDALAGELVLTARDVGWRRDRLLAALAGRPGFYLPSVHGDTPPPIAAADDALLPARSQILTPDAELADMFMTEAARGCSRGCTYCVMRRSTNGGMRVVPTAEVLGGIPAEARRVGLVGAAVTDHPDIRAIVRGVVDGGRQVGISSLRADKLDDELVGLLARGGYRTLTVAADGVSASACGGWSSATSPGHPHRLGRRVRSYALCARTRRTRPQPQRFLALDGGRRCQRRNQLRSDRRDWLRSSRESPAHPRLARHCSAFVRTRSQAAHLQLRRSQFPPHRDWRRGRQRDHYVAWAFSPRIVSQSTSLYSPSLASPNFRSDCQDHNSPDETLFTPPPDPLRTPTPRLRHRTLPRPCC